MTLTAVIRKSVWEHDRAWQVYDWLKQGPITRAEICKKLKLKDKSLQGIFGELYAHHYVISWRDGRDTYYQLQADAIEAHRYRTRGDGLS
jgi:DNA-binding IclR family transcriptional regulator